MSVLDASAVLAYLHGEEGAELVEEALGRGAVVSSVNWAEVLSKLSDESGGDLEGIVQRLDESGLTKRLLTVLPVTEEDARTIAALRSHTRSAGLSLGDRAGLALASRLGLPILTADRAWQALSLSIQIRLIR